MTPRSSDARRAEVVRDAEKLHDEVTRAGATLTRGQAARAALLAVWRDLPLLIALVLLWMLLWGTVSWLSFASGVLVALVVTRIFFLPPVELSGRFNPFWFVVFVARFAVDLVLASAQVAWQAFRPRGVRHNAVVGVQLSTRSDFITTLTSIAVSLVPGSLVVEVDRDGGVLYVHAIAVDDDKVERVRAQVRSVERALVRALGSRADLERTRP